MGGYQSVIDADSREVWSESAPGSYREPGNEHNVAEFEEPHQSHDDLDVTVSVIMPGILNAVRPLKLGIGAIKTDTPVNSGNSDGRMYDSDGVAAFGPSDGKIGQIEFDPHISTVEEFLKGLNVVNRSKTYRLGIIAFLRKVKEEMKYKSCVNIVYNTNGNNTIGLIA